MNGIGWWRPFEQSAETEAAANLWRLAESLLGDLPIDANVRRDPNDPGVILVSYDYKVPELASIAFTHTVIV